ncbi:hypothetical protein [Peribacillus deserti]|uniref:Uncharacterized protein n=1 Tax=Peribacillus deserti TaxID=673318 RepID=A0A2N5MBW8_9BACI|nr:hypothetical protein [Peribacillus deserti]PLT31841.1 hypothetical protein CUU66_01395 [Peribacillus deserti]
MSKYLSYVFLIITLILFALIWYGVSLALGSFGRAVIIAMIVLPALSLIAAFKSKGAHRWISIVLSLVFICTFSLLGVVSAFLLNQE